MEADKTIESYLRRMFNEAQKDVNEFDKRIVELKTKRAKVVENVRAYEVALNDYLKQIGKGNQVSSVSPLQVEADWEALFKDANSHREKLLAIATHDQGILKFSRAVDILYGGHYMQSKSRENAYIQLSNVVKDMTKRGELDKIEQGTYKLASKQQKLGE